MLQASNESNNLDIPKINFRRATIVHHRQMVPRKILKLAPLQNDKNDEFILFVVKYQLFQNEIDEKAIFAKSTSQFGGIHGIISCRIFENSFSVPPCVIEANK